MRAESGRATALRRALERVPPSPPTGESPSPERRRFLAGVCLALGAVTAAVVAVPVVAFVLSPLLKQAPDDWRAVGKVDDFAIGTTTQVSFDDPSSLPWAGVASQSAAWLRRETADQFVAFSINCTHLGCPVRWEAVPQLFMCPCHGGVFYQDGSVAAGPPPQPLTRLNVRINGDSVEVRTRGLALTGGLQPSSSQPPTPSAEPSPSPVPTANAGPPQPKGAP